MATLWPQRARTQLGSAPHTHLFASITEFADLVVGARVSDPAMPVEA